VLRLWQPPAYEWIGVAGSNDQTCNLGCSSLSSRPVHHCTRTKIFDAVFTGRSQGCRASYVDEQVERLDLTRDDEVTIDDLLDARRPSGMSDRLNLPLARSNQTEPARPQLGNRRALRL
jgi:hypothetical protein